MIGTSLETMGKASKHQHMPYKGQRNRFKQPFNRKVQCCVRSPTTESSMLMGYGNNFFAFHRVAPIAVKFLNQPPKKSPILCIKCDLFDLALR